MQTYNTTSKPNVMKSQLNGRRVMAACTCGYHHHQLSAVFTTSVQCQIWLAVFCSS
jgi:putative NADPH-quinone reductase